MGGFFLLFESFHPYLLPLLIRIHKLTLATHEAVAFSQESLSIGIVLKPLHSKRLSLPSSNTRIQANLASKKQEARRKRRSPLVNLNVNVNVKYAHPLHSRKQFQLERFGFSFDLISTLKLIQRVLVRRVRNNS